MKIIYFYAAATKKKKRRPVMLRRRRRIAVTSELAGPSWAEPCQANGRRADCHLDPRRPSACASSPSPSHPLLPPPPNTSPPSTSLPLPPPSILWQGRWSQSLSCPPLIIPSHSGTDMTAAVKPRRRRGRRSDGGGGGIKWRQNKKRNLDDALSN